MKVIYEKEISVEKDNVITGEFKEVDKKEATHKHICRHDEGKSCSREKI